MRPQPVGVTGSTHWRDSVLMVTVLSEAGLRRLRGRLLSRVASVRWRLKLSPHTPSGLELNINVLRRAGAERGIDVEELPGGFFRLRRGDRESYAHGSDLAFEPLVPWFICGDKELTNLILAKHGLPVLPSASFMATDFAGALAYFRRLPKPVVVKPTRNTYGSAGVVLNVTTPRQFRSAFARALTHGRDVLVEVQATGDHLRVTVVRDEVLGVVRRIPAHVIGDGRTSIEALIARKNLALRRADPGNQLLEPITIDREVKRLLAARGLRLQSVPAAGEVLYLRDVVSAAMGGELRDVTDVHPTLLTLARSAARALGPVVCAVDLIVKDPRAPADSQNAVINEVNTTPGLDVANEPVEGIPSLAAARKILDHLPL
jgi:cyanophycin synthetase